MQVDQTRLGDLRTLFINSPGATASTVQMWFRAGSALENEDNAGIAHFLEHMFFKGTQKRPGAAIAQEVESFGGEINAFTSFDYTCYYINSPARQLPKALEILLDMVAHPMFKDEDFPAEREVVFEEYRRALDNPSQFHFMKLQSACFEKAYQHPILGFENNIKNFSPLQLRQFRQQFYNLQNSMLVIAGDLSERSELEKLITSFELPNGERSNFDEFHLNKQAQVSVHEKQIRQATLTMALPAPDYESSEATAEDLAVNCLAHGETSRLYQALVAQTSLCNGIAGSTMYFAHNGCHMIKASFPFENLTKVLNTFEKTLKDVFTKQVQESEISKIKNQYLASKIYEKESIEAFAFSLGHGFAQNGDIHCEEMFINRLKETSALKVIQAIPTVFSRPLHCILQVPEGSNVPMAQKTLHAFQKKIKRLAATHTVQAKSRKLTLSKHDPAVSLVEILPGVHLIHRLNRMTPTFVLHQYIKGGVASENSQNCGQHNMLSRLFTYGYKGMPYETLKQDLESSSASLSGFSGKNAYGLTLHGQSTHFDKLIGHFAGTITAPSLPPKYFQHERRVLLRMLDNQKEDPVKQAFKRWYQLMFKGHPYALDASGTPETLKRMTPQGLAKLHQSRMKQEGMLFTYCGDMDLETVASKLLKSLKTLKGRKVAKPAKRTIKPDKGVVEHIEMQREQVQIIIGRPGYKMGAQEDLYLKMISAHLSGQGSELFVEVRDRQGLCYAVQPIHVTSLEGGCWGIYIGAGHDKRERAHRAIADILERLSRTGLTLEEFERIKAMIDGQQQLSLQTNEDFAQFYSVPVLHGYELDYQHEAHQKIRAAKYEDFQKFLKEFMGGPWDVITVGPS